MYCDVEIRIAFVIESFRPADIKQRSPLNLKETAVLSA